MKLGAHIGIARGLAWTAAEAIRLKCECLQIFLSNPRGWAPAVPDDADVAAEWRSMLDGHRICPLIGHSSYLVNLASPNPELRRKSIASLEADMRRGAALGVGILVVPGGFHTGAGPAQGRRAMAAGLREVSRMAGDAMLVLVENTAGAGSSMNWRFQEMAAMLSQAGDKPNLGICLDTCHLHAAGYDLSAADGMRDVLERFDRLVGLSRLGAMHLNDAKYAAGSRRDAHTHIGRGTIGCEAFRALLADRRLADLPGIIETPKEGDADTRNLRLLRQLRGHDAARRAGGASP
jgi:deoxyribonuclease-4